MKIINHKLTDTKYLSSPNFDERPKLAHISLIVLHNISLPPGEYGGFFIEQFFLNKLLLTAHPYFKTIAHLKLSAHLLIKRNGALTQFVPFDKRAWHAGKSFYKGRKNCNDFAIGIELEGSDDVSYEEVQYQQLRAVIKQLKKHYSITNIVGHCDIAPARKTDPGLAFDWAKIV